MNTLLIKRDTNFYANITNAANIIQNGGLVAFPTETVYGLGADIFNEKAVRQIYNIKHRTFDKPLSAHISSITQVNLLSEEIPDIFYKLAEHFLPGPLAIIIKAKTNIPSIVTANTGTIAIRFPHNDICKQFIDECGVALAATSANISGNVSPINAKQVESELTGKIDAIIDGGECNYKIESTIISIVDMPKIVRVGAISIDEIEQVTELSFA